MKRHLYSLVFSLLLPLAVVAESVETNIATQVAASPVFQGQLFWIGNAPTELESADLLNALNAYTNSSDAGALDRFIERNPKSSWTPALEHQLAKMYRQQGGYSTALKYWEAAWNSTKQYSEGPGKNLGDSVLGNWIRLLSVLGRRDDLAKLFKETSGRDFTDAEGGNAYRIAQEAFTMMSSQPGIAYRCGTLALANIGRQLFGGTPEVESLVDLPSPETGFSLADLERLSREHKLGLVAVKRPAGKELVVPSVVHWKENHYAAILREETAGVYKVVDPTFGKPRWLTVDAINQEASGYFLVPEKKRPAAWQKVSTSEMANTFGKGVNNAVNDGKDHGCDKKPADKSECPPCGKKRGMPIWWISEPYINLWLSDEPLAYRTKQQEEIVLRLTFKQRDTRSNISSSRYDVPQSHWNVNWFSYIDVTEKIHSTPNAFLQWDATVYDLDGGETTYAFDEPEDEVSRTRLQPVWNATNAPITGVDTNDIRSGFRLLHPDGSQDIYGVFFDRTASIPGVHNGIARISKHIDPMGRTNLFLYESTNSLLRLKYMVDYDNRTNTLNYNTNNWLSEVQSEGRSCYFYYHTNGWLTNIVDVIGLSSTIVYDQNGWPTNLITPYGTNVFTFISNTNYFGYDPNTNNVGGHVLNRAITVTEPNGGKQLFLYRFENTNLSSSYASSEVPTNTPYGTLDNGGASTYASLVYRNSFSWNQKQYSGLSTTDPESLTANDFLRGRMKHWLADSNNVEVAAHLSIEQDPSPDGTTAGQKTWYDYPGKGNSYREGTNSVDQVIAQVLPDGSTKYSWSVHNKSGFPATITSTYTTAAGGISTRSNVFVYGTNITTYLWKDAFTSHTNYSTNFNLLLYVTNWAGQVAASYGRFETNIAVIFLNGNTNTNTFLFTQPCLNTNGLGEVTTVTFDRTNARISSVLLPSGLTVAYSYNATTRKLEKIKEYSATVGRTNTVSFFDSGLLSTWEDELGQMRRFNWDALDRPLKVRFDGLTGPEGSTAYITNIYDKLDLVASKHRDTNWVYFGYNSMRQLTAFTNELGKYTLLGYCGCGSLEKITNALNQVFTINYDNQLNPTSLVFPDSSGITYNYNSLGQLTNVITASGAKFTNWFNNQGLLTLSSNAAGRVLSVTYDVLDNPTNIITSAGVSVALSFDILGRVLTRSFNGETAEAFGYSTNGLVAYTNQIGKVTRFVNDEFYNTIRVTNANTELLQFTYNAADQLLTLTDGKSQVTKWGYDSLGRMTRKTNAANAEILRLTYDLRNNVTNRWTLGKGDTKYTFDGANNLTLVDYANSTDIQFAYDALNRLTNMIDAVGTSAFGYTSAGLLESENGPWASDTLTFSYQNLLRTNLALQRPSAADWTQTYTYDATGRVTNTVSDAGTFAYQYAAGPSKLIQKLTLPGGSYITNTFDAVTRMTGTWLKNSANQILDYTGYTNNEAFQRTDTVRTAGDFVHYSYDNIGQLVQAVGKESGGSTSRLSEQLGYFYDAAGNLNRRTNNALVQAFNVDSLNQLSTATNSGTLTVEGMTTSTATNVTVNTQTADLYQDKTFAKAGFTIAAGNNTFTAIAQDALGRFDTNAVTVNLPATVTYSYDGNQNLTNDSYRVFAYDDENQLTSIFTTNQWKSEFSYDGLGRRRIRKEYAWQGGAWVQTNEVRYVYDRNVVIQERDGNNTPLISYTRGLDLSGTRQGAGGIGGLLARTEHSTSRSAFYHSDGNGNVTAMVTSQQILVARYLYDPFGNVLGKSGPWADANTYRFSSLDFHINSGLAYDRFRYYDPNLSRWINADPIEEEGGINLHSYVNNDPINNIDPFGFSLEGPMSLYQKEASGTQAENLDALVDALEGIRDAVGDAIADLQDAIDQTSPRRLLLPNDVNDEIDKLLYGDPNSGMVYGMPPMTGPLGKGKPCVKSGTGPKGGPRNLADQKRMEKQREARRQQRENKSRAMNGQNRSGEGFRDHESADKGPSGKDTEPKNRDTRERNIGIDEEHSKVAKGSGGMPRKR